ncbi:MAG: metallophosphoesterase [Bacteroidaceae bacterium]|nr:metallophosphoesterase [Bacteroidaceae bacterium]MBQ9498815.1 metallophosphoesterase [Bacteroidaceae bacterium]
MRYFGLLVFMLLPFLGFLYTFWHVWQLLPAPWWVRLLVILLMLGAFASMFVGMRDSHTLSLNTQSLLYDIGTSSLIILLYLVMLFMALDVLRLVHLVPAGFMKHSWPGTLTVVGIMLAVFIYGNWHYHHKVRQPLELKTEKTLAKPLKILMMSDLHLGYGNRRADFSKWVDMLNAEQADLILIAGDIIDSSTKPLLEEASYEEFRRLNAPVVACLGNHEYFSGEPDAKAFYDKAGIRLLRDEVLEWGDLCIIGRDDRSNPRRKSLAELTSGIDRSKYSIVLDHQPYELEKTEAQHIDFQLSGHTHHGQVWPISWITEHVYECAFGPWQRGDTQYYVSSGIGIWGGKFRIGTRSEYVVATLLPM